MNRVPLSSAASNLMRAIIARGGVPRERILLTDAQSVDWRSLTFNGERHLIDLRVIGPGSRTVVQRMCEGLEEAEFSLPRNDRGGHRRGGLAKPQARRLDQPDDRGADRCRGLAERAAELGKRFGKLLRSIRVSR